MSAKSKRNRRQVSPVRRPGPVPNVQAISGMEQPAASQSVKPATPQITGPVTNPAEGSFIIHELKWIGIVTLIVLALLIISYILFR